MASFIAGNHSTGSYMILHVLLSSRLDELLPERCYRRLVAVDREMLLDPIACHGSDRFCDTRTEATEKSCEFWWFHPIF